MLYQANLDPIIIDCEQPPVTVAWLLRDLLTTELPKTHDQGPPIIRDTLCDEQGIYFDTPVEIKEADGVFVLRIRGSVWTWDGERYLPNNEHVDVLDVEILPSGTGGSKVRVMPAFALGGIEKHIEALVARVFGGLDDAPEIPRDSERAAGNVTSTEAAGHRLATRLDDAVDRVFEDASRLAGAVMEGAQPAMEPRAAATGEKSAEVAPASEVPAEPMDDSRMKAAKVNTAVGSAAHRAEKAGDSNTGTTPAEPRLIHSEVIPGTVNHFRATMQRLAVFYREKGWLSTNGNRLGFWEHRQSKRELVSVEPLKFPTPSGFTTRASTYYAQERYKDIDVTPPTRGTWRVSRREGSGSAGIEAYGRPDGGTRLDFLDGYAPGLAGSHGFPPIGPAFEEFAEVVIQEARGDAGNETVSPEEDTAKTMPQAAALASSESDRDLKPLDRAIIKVVRQIEEEGLKATDERVAARVPPNEKNESYHRVTINRHRCKLRDKGFEV